MMSVVWDNSSDVIGISARASSGYVTTILSPTYLKMFTDDKNDRERSALAFDLDPSVFIEERGSTSTESHKAIHPTIIYNVKIGSRSSAASRKSCYGTTTSSSKDILLVSCFVDLVVRAWKSQNDVSLLTHDLVRTKGEKQIPVRCEAKITKMDPNALVVVVRDISERFKRFEAEKKVISETTARLKDAAANRFTRHEVKNGLLAAIGLCDSLRESNPAADLSATDLRCMDRSNKQRYLFELDKTLHEVLDTVLAEAMARDVIHKVYEPKLERVNVPKLLDANLERFPLTTIPVPVPDFALDPQLLKYIHRNAVSNACKYGKPGGEVLTELLWDENEEILQMTVSNLPGEGHDQILRLGEYASQLVFSPRKRLSVHTNVTVNNNASASHSSGDGAWIMHNCAMTLGGSCDIKVRRGSKLPYFFGVIY
jgi:signal transduction histidine kinase